MFIFHFRCKLCADFLPLFPRRSPGCQCSLMKPIIVNRGGCCCKRQLFCCFFWGQFFSSISQELSRIRKGSRGCSPMDVGTGSGNQHRIKKPQNLWQFFLLSRWALFLKAQFKKRRGRVLPAHTAFSCKLYFVGSAVGKEFQEQHLFVQGSGCIQLAHPASVPTQILCRKIRICMKVVYRDPMLPQILPGSSLPTSFFSSGLRFSLKYSFSRIEGAFSTFAS